MGQVGDIPITFAGVELPDGLLTIELQADGPRVEALGQAWHDAVDAEARRVRAGGDGVPPQIPQAPGNDVLRSVEPVVILAGERLEFPMDNLLTVSGFDSPWRAWWRFVLLTAPSPDALLVVEVPRLNRIGDNPVYAGPLGGALTKR